MCCAVPQCEQLPHSSAVRAPAHSDVSSSPGAGWSEGPFLVPFHLLHLLSPLLGFQMMTVE